jgi:hypothetical protein
VTRERELNEVWSMRLEGDEALHKIGVKTVQESTEIAAREGAIVVR